MQNSKKKIYATVKFRLLMERIRRPRAEITDYFKLVYQSCFGLAHSIENEELFFRYLVDELNDVKPSSELPLVEPITIFEPLARLHLQRFVFEGLNADRLYNACLTSLNTFKKGEKTHFALVADLLIAILHDRPFLFPSDKIHRVIDAYPFKTCPPFHHSPAYRTLYAPHYRLVDPEWIGRHSMMC